MANRPSLDEIFGNTSSTQQKGVSSKPSLDEIFNENKSISSVPETESGVFAKDIGQISGGILGGMVGGIPGSAIGGISGKYIPTLVEQSQSMSLPQNIIAGTKGALSPTTIPSEIVGSMSGKELREKFSDLPSTIASELALAGVSKGVAKTAEMGAKVLFKQQSTLHNITKNVKSKLIDYLKKINTEYGEELDKIVSKSGMSKKPLDLSKFQTEAFDILKRKGIVDDAGSFIGNTPIEQKIYDSIVDITTNPKFSQGVPYTEIRNIFNSMNKGINPSKVDKGLSTLLELKSSFGKNMEDLGLSGLGKLNKNYARKREIFNESAKIFKPFGSKNYDTKSSIETLRNYFSETSEGNRRLLNDLSKELDYNFIPAVKRHAGVKDLERLQILGTHLGSLKQGTQGFLRYLGGVIEPISPLTSIKSTIAPSAQLAIEEFLKQRKQ